MEYLIHLAILIAIYGMLGLSLNLVVGYTGLLSVTHAAFFGIGAYATAILSTTRDVNFFVTAVIGAALAAVISFLIGIVLSRFDDDYYVLASLGFNMIVYAIFLNWQELTRGALGIPGVGRPEAFGVVFNQNSEFLFLAILFLIATYLILKAVTTSSFGRVIQAIRDDERALQVFGYRTTYFKLTVFVFGAAIAAVAGSLFASYVTFVDPSSFLLMESVFILSIIILGGLGDHKGAVLGAAVLILLPEILRFVGFPSDVAAQMRQVVYGVLLIVLMLFRPQGFVGKYRL